MAVARPIQVVVFGATGFTGQLVAKYLAPRAEQLALAGRDLEKLKGVRAGLGRDVELIRAESFDLASLRAMAKQAEVVITTVGPYMKYGEALVEACVEEGTDYLDLTGEHAFFRKIVDRFHDRARAHGARIVSCAGFDSIPADLGAFLAVHRLREKGETGPAAVDGFMTMKGAPSGGTWHSALGILERFDPKRDLARRPHILPHRDRATGRWIAELPLVDTLVVQRSASFDPAYGSGFVYRHHLASRSAAKVAGFVAGAGLGLVFARIGPTRRLLERYKDPGQGPSPAERAKGFFRLEARARAGDHSATAIVEGGEPGYDETSKMISEAALCLAKDLPRASRIGGVLTPATAMGHALVERLRRTGLKLTVD